MNFFRTFKINSYILKNTLFFTMLCLVLLVAIESFFTILNELQELGDENYTIRNMILYVVYDIPTRIYRIFPMALLLGCLTGLGQLSSTNELTAIRTAGFSKLRAISGSIVATILLSIVAIIFGEYIVPITKNKAESYQTRQEKGQGFWAISNDYFIQIGSTYNGDLKDVHLYKEDNQELVELITADDAALSGKNWIIPHAKASHITRDEVQVSDKYFLVLPTLIDKNALAALSTTPESLATSKLWRFIRYLDKNGLDSSEYRLVFWSKIFNPLTNLSMLLIAAPLVFSQNRQQGLGARILIGIVLGLVIYLASQMLGHFILLAGYAPIIGAIFPTILALIIAFVLYKLLPN